MSADHMSRLRGKIWEMRPKGRNVQGRVLYFAAAGRKLVGLHAFVKKTPAVPARNIKMAEQRMKEWNDG